MGGEYYFAKIILTAHRVFAENEKTNICSLVTIPYALHVSRVKLREGKNNDKRLKREYQACHAGLCFAHPLA